MLRTKSKNAKSLKKWLISEILPCFEEFYSEDDENDEGSEETKESNEEEEEGEGAEETKENDETKENNEINRVFKLKPMQNQLEKSKRKLYYNIRLKYIHNNLFSFLYL